MATWTTPKTWADGNLVDEDDLNLHLRDNLIALKEPPTDNYECDEASDYTTSSTSFVDVDATNLSLTITTTGGDVQIGFVGSLSKDAADVKVYLDIYESVVAGRIGGDDGMVMCRDSNGYSPKHIHNASFVYLLTGLSAGTHTFKLQWKVSAGTATLYAGTTATVDNHPQFWVREV